MKKKITAGTLAERAELAAKISRISAQCKASVAARTAGASAEAAEIVARKAPTPNIKTYEFETPWEAMEHAAALGWVAIYWEQKCRVVRQESADRLQAIAVKFSYLCEQNNQITLVPVN